MLSLQLQLQLDWDETILQLNLAVTGHVANLQVTYYTILIRHKSDKNAEQ